MTAISVSGLRKSYGDLEAVRGIDIGIAPGEIYAFLGPNGAGKTTTVEILEGYRQRSAGDVTVLGEDPGSAPRRWRERVGIVLQECRLTRQLTPREAISQYAGYYRSPRGVEETLDLVGLRAKADARVSTLSGGQQRRVDVALALIGDPELLFLDEPTTGFDPSARRQAWQVVSSLRDLGKTVFLTTHYMDEAQALADRVAIIAGGRIVAEGAPGEITGPDGDAAKISFSMTNGGSPSDLPSAIRDLAVVAGSAVSLRADDPVPLLRELTAWAEGAGHGIEGLEVRRPSLEDHYLALINDTSSASRPGVSG